MCKQNSEKFDLSKSGPGTKLVTPQPTVSARLATGLLILATTLLVSTIGLGSLFYINYRLDRQKLNRAQLEAELMKGNMTTAIYPHADPRVGYVLNPALPGSTIWGPDGEPPYKINQIGLRGKNIGKKTEGTIRIVLVSDSWFWGWRLTDSERLESQLKAILDKHFPGNPYEVITIAMPGWNVGNEAAFIEDHIELIQPNIVVWSLAPNDSWTTPGVLPPGILVGKMSRSSEWVCPQTNFGSPEAPSWYVQQAWTRNIQLINHIKSAYNVPIIALFTDGWSTFVTMLRKLKPEFSIIMISPHFQATKEWYIRYPDDAHPSTWGIKILSISIFGALIEHSLIPAATFDEQEHDVIARGRLASEDVSSKEVDTFINSGSAPFNPLTYPSSYSRLNGGDGDVHRGRFGSLGISVDWQVCPQGRLLVHKAPETQKLVIMFDKLSNDASRANGVSCKAIDAAGSVTEGKGKRVGERMICDLSFPNNSYKGLLDVFWYFDRFSCSTPYDCFSARFVYLGPDEGAPRE